LQQFDKDFRIMQQQIQARHITLEAQIQAFLALFGPRHDNPSQTELSPPKRKPMINVIYSQSVSVKYFFETYGNHTQPDTHWHYRIRRSTSQNLRTASHIFYECSITDRHTFDGDQSTVLSSISFCTAPRPLPTAPTKPPFYDNNLSKGKRLWLPLTGPMMSYCPPWPPPH